MGYYTDFTLDVTTNGESVEDIINYVNNHEIMSYALLEPYEKTQNDVVYFDTNEECKWYDHDTDMIVMSARFPKAQFILEGQGEDYDDGWQTWYEGGEIKGNRAKEWSWTDWA